MEEVQWCTSYLWGFYFVYINVHVSCTFRYHGGLIDSHSNLRAFRYHGSHVGSPRDLCIFIMNYWVSWDYCYVIMFVFAHIHIHSAYALHSCPWGWDLVYAYITCIRALEARIMVYAYSTCIHALEALIGVFSYTKTIHAFEAGIWVFACTTCILMLFPVRLCIKVFTYTILHCIIFHIVV